MKEEHLAVVKKEREPLGEVLRRNIDMAVAAAGLLLLVLYLAGIVLGPPNDLETILAEQKDARETTATQLQMHRFDQEAWSQRVDALSARVRAGFGPTGLPPVEVPENVTYPPVLVELARAGATNEIAFPPPKDVKATPEYGMNRIEWNVDQDNNVPLAGFAVLRSIVSKEGGEGPPQEIATVPGDTQTYEDHDVKPGVVYRYRVVAVTEDPAVRSDARRSQPSPLRAESEVTAKADFTLSLMAADMNAKKATFDVEKRQGDRSWRKQFEVRVGEEIGRKDIGTGVDYGTGRILESLDREERTETNAHLEVVFGKDARVRVEGGAPVTEEITVEKQVVEVVARVQGGELPPREFRLVLAEP